MHDKQNITDGTRTEYSLEIPAEQLEATYKSLKEELIGHYRKELAYIYTYHDRPPLEYYAPIKEVVTQLILHLDGRQLQDVLAECWKEAWRREPVCHPNDFS